VGVDRPVLSSPSLRAFRREGESGRELARGRLRGEDCAAVEVVVLEEPGGWRCLTAWVSFSI
jgi:hypothetical protein